MTLTTASDHRTRETTARYDFVAARLRFCGCFSACPPPLVNTDLGGQRAGPKTMHHDSKSPRYGGISQLPRTRSSGCLSACPPALVNTERFPFVYPRQRPARRRDAGGGGEKPKPSGPMAFPRQSVAPHAAANCAQEVHYKVRTRAHLCAEVTLHA